MKEDPGKTKGLRCLAESLAIAFSLYSRIPTPTMDFGEAGMRYALCFFPLIGVVIGAAQILFSAFAVRSGLGETARACIGTAIPLIITGGIHLDGFLDTVDARSSFADRDRKLEILKDPHTGAFAIIGGGIYLLLAVAAFSELGKDAFPAIGGIYVMTRALSGLSVTWFPKAKKDGLASTFASRADAGVVCVVMAAWWLASFAFLYRFAGGMASCSVAVAGFVVFGGYYRMAMREFGGMTGDLAGFFLQTAELVMVAMLAAWR